MEFQLITLGLLDDHTLFRKILANYLRGEKNINILFQASNVIELLNKMKEHVIDILILDIFMPQLNGNDAVRLIRNQYPKTKIIVLSMGDDLNLISDLLEYGIHGYISKADDPEELIKAIDSVSNDKIYRNKLFTEALYWDKENSIKDEKGSLLIELNDREKKILQLLWAEKNNKEIADQIFLSVRSVEKIRQDMKEKIGVKSTIGLFKYAIKKKIIDVNSIAAL